jgi:prepilin-type N-terminal cleavage/methylation domain-containing protein
VVRKAAFTLIELIFAIVVIAITVMSLPMMNQVISKGIDSNIVQEAVFAAATELNEAVTGHWDKNSIEPTEPNSYARVIDINGSCDNNASSPRYRLMPGQIVERLHRRCLDSSLTAPSDTNSTTVECLENQVHGYRPIFLNPTPSAEGYKANYKSSVQITYNAFFDGTNNSNIKMITTTIKKDNKIITSLKTYVANIGETDYDSKVY